VTTDDKIEALAAALDSVDRHVRIVDASAKRSEKNRLNMLHLHALAAVVIGLLFAAIEDSAMAGPNWIVIRLIPGAPETLGLFFFVGGMILGPATWYRHLKWEKVGLWMILLWYAVIAVSFAVGTLLWLTGQNPSPRAPALYAPMVYLHLTCVMAVHLVTLNRMTRLRRLQS
jgi:hypothetical protein